MPQTIIVVPCYNEADRLDLPAFRSFADTQPDIRFLFVNDGSTDLTQEVVESLRAEDPAAFDVLSLERNQGKATAVRLGLLEALASSPSVVGYWDADLSTPLDEIPRFVGVLEAQPELIAVFGSRMRSLGRHIERRPARHYSGRLFATLAAMTLGLAVYDTQCGAKAFRATVALGDLLQSPFRSRWIFDVELIARLARHLAEDGKGGPEHRILELPLNQWCDVAGSKIGPGDGLRAFVDLWRIRRAYPPPHPRG